MPTLTEAERAVVAYEALLDVNDSVMTGLCAAIEGIVGDRLEGVALQLDEIARTPVGRGLQYPQAARIVRNAA